jgi:hypothetical protein
MGEDLELAKVEAQPMALRHELSVEEVLARIRKVHQIMEKAMVQDHHYGVIPGTNKKKLTLLKPGAELLLVMFRLDPQYAAENQRDGDHLSVTSTCTLYHIPTGQRWGSGQGSCSTRESNYAWRESVRVCPTCQQPTIIKGKAEYGGGWVCFKKKGGCGAKFGDGDPQIEAQTIGRVPNPDLPDSWNTVTKMANKRSLVAAVLNVTAASDIFTQDLEDQVQTRPVQTRPPGWDTGDERPAPDEPPQRRDRASARVIDIASGAEPSESPEPPPAPSTEDAMADTLIKAIEDATSLRHLGERSLVSALKSAPESVRNRVRPIYSKKREDILRAGQDPRGAA